MEGKDEREEKKDPVPEQVRKSTLNPNAKEFNPRAFCSQGQPSPSIVVPQPPTVYSQTVCFPQMYPLTPVSPGVQKSIIWKPPAMYHVQVPHMTVSQSKSYRAVPSMPQQRPDQHHPQGTPTMMHPATAAGQPIVAQSPAYSTQYFACPQQFSSPPLVQQMPHYQSQAQHVFSPVMQGGARMMAPPTHGQASLVSSSTTQYGEQTHTMYVSPGPIPQQYTHPSATLHPHPQHPQQSATPTGQQQPQGQHGGNPPPPAQCSMLSIRLLRPCTWGTPASSPCTPPWPPPPPSPRDPTPVPQTSYPSAQQTVYIHPQQHGYNHSHMAHVQQAHMQSGMVPSHHATPTHPPMMLMATQAPGGPQPPPAERPAPHPRVLHCALLLHAPPLRATPPPTAVVGEAEEGSGFFFQPPHRGSRKEENREGGSSRPCYNSAFFVPVIRNANRSTCSGEMF
ncbi:hypothetical protein ANANG_G00186960 [Anguilla anguilla]|uniref:Ataxin-2 C-terminal domain-containing protein n=1 Tax=Anguilla anguilla TaxID=7936 RepID=A0A9D3M7H6_ANGAN|nr:hypothetical protein ANANG_G00186960 [Anguilla anguilla]